LFSDVYSSGKVSARDSAEANESVMVWRVVIVLFLELVFEKVLAMSIRGGLVM
jgi:hypothetical protein